MRPCRHSSRKARRPRVTGPADGGGGQREASILRDPCIRLPDAVHQLRRHSASKAHLEFLVLDVSDDFRAQVRPDQPGPAAQQRALERAQVREHQLVPQGECEEVLLEPHAPLESIAEECRKRMIASSVV